ncbi:MAG: hypothetical protein A2252_02355 [Elusimicrobia bacterium RIFOXYA2_FULL_39_19]|nr:MAG: hypothetical protein A2252_02355 [Elusimicrobia bacterium RIFOXYA2_FULL_39_19]
MYTKLNNPLYLFLTKTQVFQVFLFFLLTILFFTKIIFAENYDPSFYWDMDNVSAVFPNIGGGTITVRGETGASNYPSNVTGYSGNGVLFDNRYEKIDIMTASDTYRNMDPNTGKISFWFKPSWDGAYSNSAGYFFEVKHSSKFFSYIGGSGSPVQFAVNGTGTAATYLTVGANADWWSSSQWYYFEYFWDKPSGKFGLSISSNGSVCASTIKNGAWSWDIFFSTGHVLTIGNGAIRDTYSHCRGTMDEFYVFVPSAPAAINDLSAFTGLSEGSIELNWSSPGDDGYENPLATGSSYKIQFSSLSSGVIWSTASAQVTISTESAVPLASVKYTLSGLTRGTTYYFRMWAVDEWNNWPAISNIASSWAQTIEVYPPAGITDLTAEAGPVNGSILLSWTSTGDDGYTGNFSSVCVFDLRYSTQSYESPGINNIKFNSTRLVSDFNQIPVPDLAATKTNMLVTGLTPGVTYYFAIKTIDDALNESNLSNGATSWAQWDIFPPSGITTLSAIAGLTGNSAALSWLAPGDDGFYGNNNPGYYAVRYATYTIDTNLKFDSAVNYGNSWVPVAPGFPESHEIAGLAGGVTYYFAVKTIDDAGNTSVISNSPAVDTKVKQFKINIPSQGWVFTDNQPVISGEASVLSKIEIYIDKQLDGITYTATDGSWLYNVSKVLTVGSHAINIKAYTPYGEFCSQEEIAVTIMGQREKAITVGPNPFTPDFPPYDKIVFNFDNTGNENVKISIFNLNGMKVFENEFGVADTVVWDGKRNNGAQCSDGAYLYQLKIGNRKLTGSIIIAR